MARPMKEWRYKSVGKSLVQYHNGQYTGSIPHAKLCQLIQKEQGNGKDPVLVKDVSV